jgi:DNA-directed RNA polymerase specialized sigma24 family protein
MRGENAGHTLQATALVNEAFIKLVDADIAWQNRAHFMALSARAMRQILVDHARANRSDKRGGSAIAVLVWEIRVKPTLIYWHLRTHWNNSYRLIRARRRPSN